MACKRALRSHVGTVRKRHLRNTKKERETFAVGGGESWPDVFARADGALQRLRDRMPGGGHAIVFTHGIPFTSA